MTCTYLNQLVRSLNASQVQKVSEGFASWSCAWKTH